MSLKDIVLKYESDIEDIEIEEPYMIIKNLEEKVKKLQSELSVSQEKLFEYGMGLLSSDEVEALKARNELLESENDDLLETIKEKDIEIGSLKEELSKRKKSGRPAKYDVYKDKILSLYSELQSVRQVTEKLTEEGIEISVAQVQRILKKSVS